MNPNREELLFQLALTKPADERAAFLDRECGSDAAFRARVGASLAADEHQDNMLLTQIPNSEAAAAQPPGSTGHWPVLRGNLPRGTEENVRRFW